VYKLGSRHWVLCIPRNWEVTLNVGPVSIWNVKQPLRTGILAVTVLGTERSVGRYYSKNACSETS